jgi:hypothetical protein
MGLNASTMNYEDMRPPTRQKMAKPIPTTKPTRKTENNTKHQRNGLKLTGPTAIHLLFIGLEVMITFDKAALLSHV